MIKRWLTKGFWAIADQGLFAASNFVLNVLLARWLAPDSYGAFSLIFAIFVLIGVIHTATLAEPMLVFGPGKYSDRLSEYLGTLMYGHLAFGALASLLLLFTSLGFALFGSRSLATILLALALALPFILLLWLLRRACYARLDPRLAASGGALYMLLMLTGTYVLFRGEWLSAAAAFGLMGICSLVVSLWLLKRLKVQWVSLRGSEMVRNSLNDHWTYGRWSTANEALNWVPMNIYYILVPVMGSLEAGAHFKALMNLIMPMLQVVWALSIVLLPVLVRARADAHGSAQHDRFASRVRLALIPFVLAPLLYWLLLGLFHRPLVSLLYEGRYVEHAGLLWLLGLSPVVASVKQVMGQSVRALERPDRLFWAYAPSAAATLTVGAVLVSLWGIVGAGIGFLVSQGLTAALALAVLQRLKTSQGGAAPSGRRAMAAVDRDTSVKSRLVREEPDEIG